MIGLNLKPFDLIWVEGKSVGWSYPTDIEELKANITGGNTALRPMTSFTNTNSYTSPAVNENLIKKISSGKIHVSLPPSLSQQNAMAERQTPGYSLEKKAEELRKRVEEYTAGNVLQENGFQTGYTSSLEEVKDYTNQMFHHKIKKEKSLSKKSLFIAALSLVLAAGSYFIVQSFSTTNPQSVPLVQTFSPQEDSIKTISGETADLETEEIVTSENIQSTVKENNSSAKLKAKSKSIPITDPTINLPLQKETIDKKVEPPRQDETDANSAINQQTIMDEPVAEPKEKKKTLVEKIDVFFEKLGNKKQKEPASEDQAETSTGNGSQRKSTRRNDETKSPVEEVDLASLVDIYANKTDNWMMALKV